MPTPAQLAANQANAQLSSGPATPEGLARSSRNNLRHGFRSQTVLLPGEDAAEYEALLADLTAHYQPEDLTELRFIREMADAEWRLRRLRQSIENALTRRIAALALEHPDADPVTLQTLAIETLGAKTSDKATGTSYSTWLRYEAKFERQYDRAHQMWSRYYEDRQRALDRVALRQSRELDNRRKEARLAAEETLASAVPLESLFAESGFPELASNVQIPRTPPPPVTPDDLPLGDNPSQTLEEAA